jgi:hypothetical protein
MIGITRIRLIRSLTSISIRNGHRSNKPPNIYVVRSPIDQYAIHKKNYRKYERVKEDE